VGERESENEFWRDRGRRWKKERKKERGRLIKREKERGRQIKREKERETEKER